MGKHRYIIICSSSFVAICHPDTAAVRAKPLKMAQGPISDGCRGGVAGDAKAAASETCRCAALWASTAGRGRLPEGLLQILPLWEPWQEVEAREGPKRACPGGLQRKLLSTFLIFVACCSQGHMAGPLHRARRVGHVQHLCCQAELRDGFRVASCCLSGLPSCAACVRELSGSEHQGHKSILQLCWRMLVCHVC